MSNYTTVLLPKKLKNQLDELKADERESYAHVIEKMLTHIRECDESELELSDETLKKIARAREDVAKGRVYTSKELAKKLGF